MSEYSIYTIIITTLVLLYYIHEHKKKNISNITKYFLKITLFILFTLLIYDNISLFMPEITKKQQVIGAVGTAILLNNAISPNGNIVSNTGRLVRETSLLFRFILSNSLSLAGHLNNKISIPTMIAGSIGAAVIISNKDKIYESIKKTLIDFQILSWISTLLAIFHPNPALRASGFNRMLKIST